VRPSVWRVIPEERPSLRLRREDVKLVEATSSGGFWLPASKFRAWVVVLPGRVSKLGRAAPGLEVTEIVVDIASDASTSESSGILSVESTSVTARSPKVTVRPPPRREIPEGEFTPVTKIETTAGAGAVAMPSPPAEA